MTRPQIALHVGAHKTASTHLQRSMQRSRRALHDVGVRIMNTQLHRRTLAPLQKELADGGDIKDIRAQADPIVHGAARGEKRLIISDENILGQLPRTFRKDRLYPWGRYRVATTLSVLENFDVSLFLAIRNPVTYLQSAYSESLLHMPFRDFAGFVKPCTPQALRWSVLVEEIHNRLPNTPLTIWRYEDYPAIQSQVVEALLDQPPPPGFEFMERHPRPGLSARAVQQLAFWHEDGRDIRDEALIAHAADLFPKGQQWPAPDHFDTAIARDMTAAYEADCDRICAMDGVTLLAPA